MDYLIQNRKEESETPRFDPLEEILGGTPILSELFDQEKFANLTPEEQEMARENPCYLLDV